jgi:Flagellar biosynthesis protein, FliO
MLGETTDALESTNQPQGEAENLGRAGWSLAGWLLEKIQSRFQSGLRRGLGSAFRRSPRRAPRLALLERITLAPRQQLALVEAEGRHLLVATSPDGAPTFYALDGEGQSISGARSGPRAHRNGKPTERVSW